MRHSALLQRYKKYLLHRRKYQARKKPQTGVQKQRRRIRCITSSLPTSIDEANITTLERTMEVVFCIVGAKNCRPRPSMTRKSAPLVSSPAPPEFRVRVEVWGRGGHHTELIEKHTRVSIGVESYHHLHLQAATQWRQVIQIQVIATGRAAKQHSQVIIHR